MKNTQLDYIYAEMTEFNASYPSKLQEVLNNLNRYGIPHTNLSTGMVWGYVTPKQ